MELWEIKLEILYYGISLSKSCYDSLKHGVDGNVNVDDYITTKGLMLVLNKKVYVNAKINKDSIYVVDYVDDRYVLKSGDIEITIVSIIQPPEYALNNYTLESGELITSLINVHGDRARLQPIRGCANRCKFCDLNKFKYHCNSIEVLDDAFMYVKNNVSFKHILISGGTPLPTDDSYEYLNQVYKYFGLKYGNVYPIDIMLVPRGLTVGENNNVGYAKFLMTLKSWGIKGLYVNLELYNDELRKKFIPQKDLVGKIAYYNFIKIAVKIFGEKNVRYSWT